MKNRQSNSGKTRKISNSILKHSTTNNIHFKSKQRKQPVLQRKSHHLSKRTVCSQLAGAGWLYSLQRKANRDAFVGWRARSNYEDDYDTAIEFTSNIAFTIVKCKFLRIANCDLVFLLQENSLVRDPCSHPPPFHNVHPYKSWKDSRKFTIFVKYCEQQNNSVEYMCCSTCFTVTLKCLKQCYRYDCFSWKDNNAIADCLLRKRVIYVNDSVLIIVIEFYVLRFYAQDIIICLTFSN